MKKGTAMKKAKKTKKPSKPLSPGTRKFLTVLLSIAFTGILCVGIIGIYILGFCASYVNGDVKMNIEEYKENQAQTTIIFAYDQNNEPKELTRLHGEQNRVWISLDQIPDSLENAYIALEDKRFLKHDGVDWIRTFKSVITFGKSGGGSTLTQQLIKNLTGENGYTISRKFYEILNALNLEKNSDKNTILEAYLNTVYMSHGCYGVKTASERYFGKDVSEINVAEAACLAAITKNPTKNDPISHPEENRKRQLACLNYMLEEGYINNEQYEEAKNYEMVYSDGSAKLSKEKEEQQQQPTQIQSYYVDYVIQQVINDLVATGEYSKQQASRLIYSGGLRIYSAIDENIQSQMEDVYVNRVNMPAYNKNVPDAQSAMTVMDYSGRVLGIVGGIGEKTENRGINRATRVRQPGSSIKPLTIYAPAIEEKVITYSSLVENYGIMVYGHIWPQNYGGDMGSPGSYITVQRAVAVSYNTVPAQLAKKMGVKKCYKYATEKFHLSTLTENDKAYAPMAVGGLTNGVTTVDMAAAFATFGNGGKYFKPYCYYKVTNASGTKVYLQHEETEGEQAISADTADIMNKLLQTVITDAAHMSTGRKYGISGFETFAKTGTTTDDKDRWFVGGTPYYVAAVYYGCDMPKTLSNYVSENPSGRIFDTVMTRIHQGLAAKKFTVYSPLVTSASYCTHTGLLAGSGCTDKATGWYSKNNMPGTCVSHSGGTKTIEIDGTTVVSGDANVHEGGGSETTTKKQEPNNEPTTAAAQAG